MLKVADIFCGAGGFSEGFRQMGFKITFALDVWETAIETHKLNHPDCKHYQIDILELETTEDIDNIIPDTDVIIGSPPCVAFSGSNKAGKADKTLGINLIEAYLRIVAWKKNKPRSMLKYWILENVPNSEKFIKNEYTFKELNLPGKGVALEIPTREILNAAKYGVPQKRKRFFCGNYPIPKSRYGEEKWIKIDKIFDKLENPLEGVKGNKIHDPLYPLQLHTNRLTDHYYDTTVEPFSWKQAKRLKEDHGYMGRMAFPENTDRPSRTVLSTQTSATREAMIFGGRKYKNGNWRSYRSPTIREIACIMSFPITYQFQGKTEPVKYRLVGNAVCPLLAREMARTILVKEDIISPKKFIPLKFQRPEIDLTGRPYKIKKPKRRKSDTPFSMHISYLKERNFRVDLSNRQSNFEKEKFVWTCILHHGTGKGAELYTINQQKLINVFKNHFIERFEDFKHEIEKTFKGRLPGPKKFQYIYCRLENCNGMMGPEKALQEMRILINRHYPEKKYKYSILGNSGTQLNINWKDIPIRILAGIYVCNYVVKEVNKRKEKGDVT